MKRQDEVITWPGLHGTRDAKVRVRVFDDMLFIGRTIVVLTEPDDNPGTSVTNGVEMIAAIVCDKFELDPGSVSFVEHYPPAKGIRGETFDTVTFSGPIVEHYRAGRGVIRQFTTPPQWSRMEWPPLRNCLVDRDGYPGGSAPADFEDL